MATQVSGIVWTGAPAAGDLDEYVSGRRLYGDDLTGDALAEWYRREATRYVDMTRARGGPYRYLYHALNELHTWSRLPRGRRFERVLGVGSAWGDEFTPVVNRIGHITLADVADEYEQHNIAGVPVRVVKPGMAGELPVESGSFDLVVCFAALQHVAAVTRAVREMARCVAPNGFLCLRDGIAANRFHERVMQGGPASPRGIPSAILEGIVRGTGLRLVHSDYQMFVPLRKLWARILRSEVYLSPVGVRLDRLLSRLFVRNYRYHATAAWHHLRPTSRTFILHRPAA